MRISRPFLIRLVPYLGVLLIMGGAEIGLRVFAPSLRMPLVTEVQYDEVDWYQVSRSSLQKYFPASTPLIPEFKTSLFKKEKAANGLRVFCLGESSMFGTPYQMTCNIPGMFRKQLRHLYPDREIEVVNFGASAINSNVIRDISKELVHYDPDLILLYTGHNEFYGPDGVGAGVLERQFPSIVPLKYAVSDLALAGLMRSLLRPSDTAKRSGGLNLMQQVSAGNAVRLHSSEAVRVFEQYDRNLRAIIATFHSNGIPIIVSDVVSNLLFPPFASDSIDQRVKGQVRDVAEGLEPSPMVLNAFVTDSTNAELQYWRGIWEIRERDFVSARQHLKTARDHDLLKFRAPGKINEITRRICEEQGIPFVSAESLFAAIAPAGIAGEEFFWEHLHPTARGYYEISSLFVREFLRTSTRNDSGKTDAPGRLLPFHRDSLAICWLDEAYGDLSIQHLTGRWPFNSYHRVPAVLDSSRASLGSIARQAYARSFDWDEACYRTASELWRLGDIRGARTTYEAMLDEYAYNFYTHYLLGNLLNQIRRTGEALVHYRRAIELNPRFPNARVDMGLILINTGDFDGAIGELNVGLNLLTPKSSPPLKATAYYGLSAAYANKGELDGALRYVEESLRIRPDDPDAQALRARILRSAR